jgi:hypothetical protein
VQIRPEQLRDEVAGVVSLSESADIRYRFHLHVFQWGDEDITETDDLFHLSE